MDMSQTRRFASEAAMEDSSRATGSANGGLESKVVCIVGGGLVGSSLAVVFARAGHTVRVWEADETVRTSVCERVANTIQALFVAGLLAPFDISDTADVIKRVTVAESLREGIADADFVVECVPELLTVKRAVFESLNDEISTLVSNGVCSKEWSERIILLSSTSAIPPSEFTGGLPYSSRCAVAHPVNPPHLIPVVEIVPAPFTAPDVVETTRAFMTQLKQSPVVLAREVHSFALNRLQGALLNEAMKLVDEGLVSPDDIDATVRDGLGLRWSFMGPLETIDLNAPGGVSDYAERYGPSIYELAKQQAEARPWSAEAIQTVSDAQRAKFPLSQLPERTQWRNARLMALMSHRQSMLLMEEHQRQQEAQQEQRRRQQKEQ